MAEIKPFKAVLYNQDKIKDLAKVACPPYDVIDDKSRDGYVGLSPYNMARLILPSRQEADAQGSESSIYAYAKKELDGWFNKGILYQDHEEAIYLYEQEYVYLGEKRKRIGFISLLKIDDADDSVSGNKKIYAHEHTHLGPKEDRLQLIRQVRANLSPIFALFADKNHIIKRIWDKYSQASPLIDIKADSVRHRLWRITDTKFINQARRDLKSADIFIADGHHRYEVACNYRQEVRHALGNPQRELDCDYLMTYFTDLHSRGLTILPTHRVINDLPAGILENLSDELSKYFDIYKVKNKSELFIKLSEAGKSEYVLGMYAPQSSLNDKGNKFFLLRLKNRLNLDKIMDMAKPKEYKRLCVVILNRLILEGILKVSTESCAIDALSAKQIFYTNDRDLAVRMVDSKEAQAAFFLNPVKVEEMAYLAARGQRMPPKSTFFYPKLLTGLLLNRFSEDMSKI